MLFFSFLQPGLELLYQFRELVVAVLDGEVLVRFYGETDHIRRGSGAVSGGVFALHGLDFVQGNGMKATFFLYKWVLCQFVCKKIKKINLILLCDIIQL